MGEIFHIESSIDLLLETHKFIRPASSLLEGPRFQVFLLLPHQGGRTN
jgi:hypothetical protein